MASVEQFDLAAAAYGGLIHESVMNKLWDISNIPLPLTDRIGTDSHDNAYTSWTVDALQSPATDNAWVDSATTTGEADEALGTRRGNHTQTSIKVVKVGSLAQAANTIAFADALTQQIVRRQRELRRDVEAQMLTNQASVAEASGTAGVSAGLGAWIANGSDNGSTAGGWNSTTGIVDARTSGGDATDVVMTEAMLRDAIKDVYTDGGESTVFMTTPSLIEQLSIFLFSSSARIASLQSDIREKTSGAVATAAINLFVGDFGTVELVPNRLQQVEGTTTCVNAFVLDPTMLRLSYYSGYQVEPLAKTGLFDQRQMRVSYTLKVLNEDAQAIIADIIQNGTITAT